MQRWKLFVLAAAPAVATRAGPASAMECADLGRWPNSACRTMADTYRNGENAVLLSGCAGHKPWTATAERRAEENARARGGARSIEASR